MLDSLPTHHLKTARAYQIRLAFQDLYEQPSTQTAAAFLKKWISGSPTAGSNR